MECLTSISNKRRCCLPIPVKIMTCSRRNFPNMTHGGPALLAVFLWASPKTTAESDTLDRLWVAYWELCSFNNLCVDKYRRLGIEWPFADAPLLERPHGERLFEMGQIFFENASLRGRFACAGRRDIIHFLREFIHGLLGASGVMVLNKGDKYVI